MWCHLPLELWMDFSSSHHTIHVAIFSLCIVLPWRVFFEKKKKKETRIIKVLFSCYYITIWIGTESPICNALINFIWNFNILPSLSPGHSNFLRQASSNSCHIRWWSSARFDYQMLLPKKKISKRLWIWLLSTWRGVSISTNDRGNALASLLWAVAHFFPQKRSK